MEFFVEGTGYGVVKDGKLLGVVAKQKWPIDRKDLWFARTVDNVTTEGFKSRKAAAQHLATA